MKNKIYLINSKNSIILYYQSIDSHFEFCRLIALYQINRLSVRLQKLAKWFTPCFTWTDCGKNVSMQYEIEEMHTNSAGTTHLIIIHFMTVFFFIFLKNTVQRLFAS